MIGKHLLFISFFSFSVKGWECPVCKMSFASDGSVPHACDAETTNPLDFTNLIRVSGFSMYPSSYVEATNVFEEYLDFLPLEGNIGLEQGTFQWLYHWFEKLGLCEHDSMIDDAKITPYGKVMMEQAKFHQLFMATTLSEKLIVSFEENSSVLNFKSWYYDQAEMCSCSSPEDIYGLFYSSLKFFHDHSNPDKPYDKFPIEVINIRNCFISWMIYQRLLTPQLILTEKGIAIMSALEKGYPKYINNPFS